ncbi:MAG: DTW domain-containing protein [Deltaproteobacteria bacterium]|nr:DTW domain-containing protein [Deltaproteobacteria bacterium]
MCRRCWRPRSVCFCEGITPIATKTRVLILQHPRERDVGLGTARLARACLAGALLRTDVDFGGDPVVREVLAAGNAYVLFPGPDAVAVEAARFPSPITLVVLDGTWWQAKKLLKVNPALAALPRLALTQTGPSVYGRIRREPADHCVATIEAIAHVLGHLEGDPTRFAELLRPLGNMVERQLRYATEVAAGRHRRVSIADGNPGRVPIPSHDASLPATPAGCARVVPRPPRDPVPVLLRERAKDVVCVHGEANAWPLLDPERTRPEIVHWLGQRLGSGETFASVIAPRGRLAPSTCHHIRLSQKALAGGESWEAFVARFRAFLCPRDVLVSWGHFPLATLLADGYQLEHAHLDARPIVGHVLRSRTGTVEECVQKMAIPLPAAWAPGRGGARLAGLCAVVEKLLAWPIGS